MAVLWRCHVGRDLEDVARTKVFDPTRAGRNVPTIFLPISGVLLKSREKRFRQLGGLFLTFGCFFGGSSLCCGPFGICGRKLRRQQKNRFAAICKAAFFGGT